MKKLILALSITMACIGNISVSAQKNIIKRTVTLGRIKSADAYRAISRKRNYYLERADKILDQVPFAQKDTEVTICILTVRDLGFDTNTTYREVCKRALALGYQLCPAEVGPALRMQYRNQPNQVRLDIVMQPIQAKDGFVYTFCVEHIESPLQAETRTDVLDGRFWYPNSTYASWFPNDHVVFMCSK